VDREEDISHKASFIHKVHSYLYRNSKEGITFLQVVKIPRVIRCAFCTSLIFVRYNLYNDFLRRYHTNGEAMFWTLFTFLATSALGGTLVGILNKYILHGRKIKLYLCITVSAFLFDLVLIVLMTFLPLDSELECIFAMIAGLHTFMLYHITVFIFSADIGKIELLKRNRKVYGLVIAFIMSVSYLSHGLIFMNIQLFFPADRRLYIITCQTMCIICLLISTVPLFAIYKEEENEIFIISKG